MSDAPELELEADPRSGSTPQGLPYPSATDPVAGGAAAIQALATAVDGKLGLYYVGSHVLAAPASKLEYAGFPSTFRRIVVDWKIAPIVGANFDQTVVSLGFKPAIASSLVAFAGQGNGVGYNPQAGGVVAIGAFKYHGIYVGAAVSTFFAHFGRLELLNGWQNAERHGYILDTVTAADVNGTAADVGLLRGMGQIGGLANQVVTPLTGIEVTGSRNFQTGSRLDVYGLL